MEPSERRPWDDLNQDQERDVYRHRERILKHLKEGIQKVLQNRDLISDGDERKRVRIPVDDGAEGDFSIAPVGKRPGVPSRGIGQGDSRPGDVVGTVPVPGGKGTGAGNSGHEPSYWIEMQLGEIAELVFSDLNLPKIRQKRSTRTEEEEYRPEQRHPFGPPARLDRKKSLIDHLKREILTGDSAWHEEDLKYRVFSRERRPAFEAAVVFVRDASGSMGPEETDAVYIAAWWVATWLRRNYRSVAIHWVIHGTHGEEVSEQDFFRLANMGGTMVSSGLEQAYAILERHPNANWYVLFYSDGMNFPEDNVKMVRMVETLAAQADLVGYGEVGVKGRSASSHTELSPVMQHLARVDAPDVLRVFSPLHRGTVGPYLQAMFGEGASS